MAGWPLIQVDNDEQDGTTQGLVVSQGGFLFVALGYFGVASYSIDAFGKLTFISKQDQGGWYEGTWGDGTFIYSVGSFGIRSYSVDGFGNLTFVDAHVNGVDYYKGCWGDGTFIYTGSFGNPPNGVLRSYSVDGFGNLTYKSGIAPIAGSYVDIWGDGTFIYVANGTGGVMVVTVDAFGVFTYIGVTPIVGAKPFVGAGGVWGDGSFIYARGSNGLATFTVDGGGNLTQVSLVDLNALLGGIS